MCSMLLQVYPPIWQEVHQRGSCAIHQAPVRTGHPAQAGDQHDAGLCSSSHQPSQVILDIPHPHRAGSVN